MINSLNMAPNLSMPARNKVWFDRPWEVELVDAQSFAFTIGTKPICGEDGDMEVLHEDIREKEQELQRRAELHKIQPIGKTDMEEELLDDGVPALRTAESEMHDIILELLSGHEDQVRDRLTLVKVVAFVEFDRHWIFKSTLVGQLNSNPFLSKSKLTLVKKSLYFNNSEDYLNVAQCLNTCFVGIGSDVEVYFMQHSTITRSSSVIAAKKGQRSRLVRSVSLCQLCKAWMKEPIRWDAFKK